MSIRAGFVANVQPAPHTHKHGQTKELREVRMNTAKCACGGPLLHVSCDDLSLHRSQMSLAPQLPLVTNFRGKSMTAAVEC